ncbi:DUF481 domain-containing protein [Flammeovirga sp. SJP92]|uniref:DUF481 domain-containing protein n=1 Tax=Flammeovirga sp. SJP92 TaxID=1775430 RepID=UPI0007C6F6A3|nr:DUF481 domain-containing protein [Flammeovirga sp. SJP92]
MRKFTLLLFFFAPLLTYAQMDSLVMINGDIIVGEIKSMDRGVVEIETDYSDSNFKIEWEGIQSMVCNTDFMVTLSNGRRISGKVVSEGPESLQIVSDEEGTIDVNPDDIVNLKSVEKSFLSKLSASIDVGYSYTKANNLSQLNGSAFIGYNTKRWALSLSLNSLRSTQDNVAAIERNDGTLTGNYFLPYGFYGTVDFRYLTNTEQSINLRTTSSLGVGKYIIHTNTAYWGFSTGASFLNESFTQTVDENGDPFTKPSNNSAEWYIGTEVNLFDTGDLSFNTNARGSRTLTGEDRWRADVGANIKYDLPYDFYIKAGYNMNYDSQPAEVGKEVDYQYSFGFGWEL